MFLNFGQLIKQISEIMGSSCCRSKEFTLSLANLPNFYYEQQSDPLPIDSLLSLKAKTHPIKSQCCLQQSQNGDFLCKQEESTNTLFLLKSNLITGNFSLLSRAKDTEQHSLWKVMRKDQVEMLSKGDRIKLGLQEFKVFDVRCPGEEHGWSAQMRQMKQLQQMKETQETQQQEEHCRYCFKNSFSEVDPLLSLCKCAGSVKYIHLGCLRTWMNSKAEKSENNLHLRWFKFEMPRCEICRTHWPRTFNYRHRDYELFSFTPEATDLALPSSSAFASSKDPYIVLQSSGIDQNDNEATLFVRINLRESCIIGSDHSSCRLQLDFPGIGPRHAVLFHCNNHIFVSDCGSAGGTLVKARNVELFSPSKGLLLLYKNMLVSIASKRSFWECNNSEPQSFIEITKEGESYMS